MSSEVTDRVAYLSLIYAKWRTIEGFSFKPGAGSLLLHGEQDDPLLFACANTPQVRRALTLTLPHQCGFKLSKNKDELVCTVEGGGMSESFLVTPATPVLDDQASPS